MAKVIKIKEWSKRKDPKKGQKLQILSNRMFMAGDTGPKYLKVRKAAEYHLGFWDWQTKRSEFGRTGETSDPNAYLPEKCVQVRCPHLPAGRAACTDPNHECP
jgi:hypothetical protein